MTEVMETLPQLDDGGGRRQKTGATNEHAAKEVASPPFNRSGKGKIKYKKNLTKFSM